MPTLPVNSIVIDNAFGRSYSDLCLAGPDSSTNLTGSDAPNSRHCQKIMGQENIPSTSADGALLSDSDWRRCVLLAEDDRALRRFLGVLLERAGYEVISASDGIEAMKIALSQPVDVVVTDSMMPNLSGHEFCRFIRSSQKLSHLPIILLSGLERKDAAQNVEQADAFLAKPVSGEELVECIEKLLRRTRPPMNAD